MCLGGWKPPFLGGTEKELTANGGSGYWGLGALICRLGLGEVDPELARFSSCVVAAGQVGLCWGVRFH